MNNNRVKPPWLCILLLLFSTSLLATAETDFELGVSAFKANDYATAARYFEQAMQQGLDSVALQYNLASSYYKLGQYASAKEYFDIVNKTDAMRELAHYNLGLIAVKLKQWRTARRHFNTVIESGRDEKLTRLSKKQLRVLRTKENVVSTYISVNYGYDDNISSATNDSVLNISDSFLDLYGSADVLLSGTRKQGWVADASLYRIDFSDSDQNDEDVFSVGVKKAVTFDDWETSGKFNFSQSTFGEEDYLDTARLEFRLRKPISSTERIYLRYRIEDIQSKQDIYSYLDGTRQRARVEYRDYEKNHSRQFYYELETNSRGELITSSYAYDYSPTRHNLYAGYTHYADNRWQLSGDLTYRFSDFPASSSFDRNDDRWKLALGASYRVDRSFRIKSQLQFIDNNSSVERYRYDKSIIKIGLSKFF